MTCEISCQQNVWNFPVVVLKVVVSFRPELKLFCPWQSFGLEKLPTFARDIVRKAANCTQYVPVYQPSALWSFTKRGARQRT